MPRSSLIPCESALFNLYVKRRRALKRAENELRAEGSLEEDPQGASPKADPGNDHVKCCAEPYS